MEAILALRILLPVMTYPDATPAAALPRAADMAATLGAHVTAVVHDVDIPPIENPVAEFLLALKAEAANAERQSRRVGTEIEQQLKHLSGRIGLALTVERLKAERACGELMAEKARCFDLTMLLCDPASPDHALLEQDVLFGSGGPVIIFPGHDVASHLAKVAIAWDGSRAAARSVHDAIPLLKRAGAVHVLTCTQDKPINPASIDGLLALLSAHDVEATHVPVVLGDQPIGITLQTAAVAHDAGMLVMGAYGHSRMREFIMGGATASVLRNPMLPLFMSH
jgi:nucleotide-binding universal stress UspA family protein